jgi:hypothetical protein
MAPGKRRAEGKISMGNGGELKNFRPCRCLFIKELVGGDWQSLDSERW